MGRIPAFPYSRRRPSVPRVGSRGGDRPAISGRIIGRRTRSDGYSGTSLPLADDSRPACRMVITSMASSGVTGGGAP